VQSSFVPDLAERNHGSEVVDEASREYGFAELSRIEAKFEHDRVDHSKLLPPANQGAQPIPR
jgi:hypothetical protein